MVDKKMLEEMAKIHINDINPDFLVDILEVNICGGTPSQRLESCLSQVGNPYCFRVGNTPVEISFRSGGQTLDKKIRSYFLG